MKKLSKIALICSISLFGFAASADNNQKQEETLTSSLCSVFPWACASTLGAGGTGHGGGRGGSGGGTGGGTGGGDDN